MIERLTQQQKENLLRDYFAGAMSTASEQEFFVQVALDDDLRQMLKAHSIVRSTLEQGHALPSVDHHNARARMIASLAARRAEPPVDAPLRQRRLRGPITGFLGAATVAIMVWMAVPSSTQKSGSARLPADTVVAKGVEARPSLERPAVVASPVDTMQGFVASESHMAGTRKESSIPTDERPPSLATKKLPPPAARPDTTVAPVALRPAASVPSVAADTIREKSRDTMTFRLRVRKVEE